MTEIVTSIITVIGVLAGAWAGNRLSRQASREQVLFSRAHERREEILTRVYGLILEVRDAYWQVYLRLRPPVTETWQQNAERLEKADDKLTDRIRDLRTFYHMNAIWLSSELCDQIEHVIALFHKQELDKLSFEVMGRSLIADRMDRGAEIDEEIQKNNCLEEQNDFKEWLQREGNPSIKKLEEEFRSVLGVATTHDLAKPRTKWQFWKSEQST